MTDSQFTILVGVLGTGLAGIGAVIKWSVGVLTNALKENTKAMIANSASNATLSAKIDGVSSWIRHTTPGHGVPAMRVVKNKPEED